MTSPDNPLSPAPPRRNFLASLSALVLGALLPLAPLGAALASLLNPIRSSVRQKQQPTGSEDIDGVPGYYNIGPLESFSAAAPQLVKITANRKDAWNIYPQAVIGSIFVQRQEGEALRVFSVLCPHAGCAVDFKAEKKAYDCPCHDSTFTDDGKRSVNSPSGRDLDTLDYKVEDGEVYVRFVKYKSGVEHKQVM